MDKAELKVLWTLAQRLVEHVQRGNRGVLCYRFTVQDRVLQMDFTNGTVLTAGVIWDRSMFNVLYAQYTHPIEQRWAVYSDTLSLVRSRAEFQLLLSDKAKFPTPISALPHWAKYFIIREERPKPDEQSQPVDETDNSSGDRGATASEQDTAGNNQQSSGLPAVVPAEQPEPTNSQKGDDSG